MLHVNALCGDTVCSVPLCRVSTALDLKHEVQRLEGTPRHGQRLLLEGHELEDGDVLEHAIARADMLDADQSVEAGVHITFVKVDVKECEQRRKEDAAARTYYTRWHGGEALCRAASQADSDAVNGLLRRDRALLHSTMQGSTPLFFAANKNIAVQLLHALANPNARDTYENTPLHRVSKEGKRSLVQLLLSARADPLATNQSKTTPLHSSRNLNVAYTLLGARADATIQDKYGNTPLHVVDDSAVANLLLDHRAEPNIRNHHGNTPLHLALSTDVVGTLLSARADVNARGEIGAIRREITKDVSGVEFQNQTSEGGAPFTRLDSLRLATNNNTLPSLVPKPSRACSRNSGSKVKTARRSSSRR